jgi:hypothetical protein
VQREIRTKTGLGHLDLHQQVGVHLGRGPSNETPPRRNQRDPLQTVQMTGGKGEESAAYGGVNEIQEVTDLILLVEHTESSQCMQE